ncbi:hypothetical protein DPMN_149288 [Dreissena polymorpha]|uniref:C3/C5 convertase n=1 Tax=Dreissena polymorpha TaxID=45954 RepID=A0A9D4FB33_DREPO|nr:hypothetical protein DPMN_149288 [Dreissena polymorpha]
MLTEINKYSQFICFIEITCDAMSYQNVRDGSITNYKNVYQFQEVLKLKCDEGFRPYNNRDYMQCLTVDSFKNQNFKCEQIICLTPPEPLHGRIETTKVYYFPNETAVFACDYGYTMVGSPVWECQSSGEWNKSCVQCEREDDFCQPPCVQLGSRIVDSPRRIEIGTTIEFACDQMVYGGSTNRTCLFNKQWSNEPIDCTGWSLFTPNTGIYLKEALSKSLVNAVIRSNNSHNISDDKGLTQGRTINVNKIFGVDVYILIDVSKSIDDNETDVMKKFVVALVQNLDVSDKNDGTRVAVYLFATTMKALFSQRDALTEANIIEQINEIDSKTIREFQHGEGGTGTAISTALEDVHTDILTKRQMTPRTRDAQQVVILISDGKYTQRGSPVQFARNLKDLEVELYSIFVGKKEEDTTAYRLMEEMASKIGTEKHFFAIDSNNDMTDVINGMITKAPALPCGSVHTILTKTNDVNQSLYSLAEKSAWPWMVQLRTSSQVICGGTLISDQWILTAAHCFNESDPSDPSSHQNRIGTVELKTWKTDATDPFKISVPIHYTRPITKDEKNKNVFIHTKYNNPDTKSRNFTYDIALIQLPNKVTMDIDLSPVCLWGNTTEDIENFSYSSLFKHGTYGVVTGWGYNNTNNSREKYMKQMQFPIQNFNTCEQHIPKNETPHMSEEFMFCAGTPGDDSNNIIDACSGDSGGPFMVPHPRKNNQYIQIGIVSFGIGNKCREHPYRGYYTKLNEELLGWINTIVKKYSQEK